MDTSVLSRRRVDNIGPSAPSFELPAAPSLHFSVSPGYTHAQPNYSQPRQFNAQPDKRHDLLSLSTWILQLSTGAISEIKKLGHLQNGNWTLAQVERFDQVLQIVKIWYTDFDLESGSLDSRLPADLVAVVEKILFDIAETLDIRLEESMGKNSGLRETKVKGRTTYVSDQNAWVPPRDMPKGLYNAAKKGAILDMVQFLSSSTQEQRLLLLEDLEANVEDLMEMSPFLEQPIAESPIEQTVARSDTHKPPPIKSSGVPHKELELTDTQGDANVTLGGPNSESRYSDSPRDEMAPSTPKSQNEICTICSIRTEDLSKHTISAHIRPHRCSSITCPRHTNGFSTLKELARHTSLHTSIERLETPSYYQPPVYGANILGNLLTPRPLVPGNGPTPISSGVTSNSSTAQHGTYFPNPYWPAPGNWVESRQSTYDPDTRQTQLQQDPPSQENPPPYDHSTPYPYAQPRGRCYIPPPIPILSNIHNPSGKLAMNIPIPFNSSYAAVPSQLSAGTPEQQDLSSTNRPFKCDQCPQSFNRNHDLKRHKRIHLAVKPFPCRHCDKSFSRKDALKRHLLVKNCGKNRLEDEGGDDGDEDGDDAEGEPAKSGCLTSTKDEYKVDEESVMENTQADISTGSPEEGKESLGIHI